MNVKITVIAKAPQPIQLETPPEFGTGGCWTETRTETAVEPPEAMLIPAVPLLASTIGVLAVRLVDIPSPGLRESVRVEQLALTFDFVVNQPEAPAEVPE